MQSTEAVTIEDLERLLLSDYQLNRRRTWVRARSSFAHVKLYFATAAPAEIGPMVPAYIAHRMAHGAAAATIKVELLLLTRSLNLALEAGLLTRRPRIVYPRVSNIRRATISPTMLDSILAYMPADCRDLVSMAYLTGWRRGELITLRWADVDLDDHVIRLEPGTTKSGYGRVFPYMQFRPLIDLIERRLRRTADVRSKTGFEIPLVFHRVGQPLTPAWLKYHWQKACERARISGVVFHDLRRCSAQNLVRAGVPIQTAMALLGHRTRSMFDRYAIVDEGDLRSGIAQLAARLRSSNVFGQRRRLATGKEKSARTRTSSYSDNIKRPRRTSLRGRTVGAL